MAIFPRLWSFGNCWRRIFYRPDTLRSRTVHYGPSSFTVTGPSTWNSLPVPLCSCHLPPSFCHELKRNCSPDCIISTLMTVCNCKSRRTLTLSIHHHHHHYHHLSSSQNVVTTQLVTTMQNTQCCYYMDSFKEHSEPYPNAGFNIFHICALRLQQLSHNEPDYHTNDARTSISCTQQ